MHSTFLMKRITKNKALGQFFSGELVARILSVLADCQPGKSIIDPMAGIGDMFIPFDTKRYRCSAVEIDPVAYQTLVNLVPSAICANAFSEETLSAYRKRGYDLVITNPPYVRWQNLNDSSALPNYLSIQTIYQTLLSFTDDVLTLSGREKTVVKECIAELSGLSDLAVPSWLLCMLLTCRTGTLAIVVPNSWMSREYSLPILRLLKELFTIEVVLNDVNSVLFKGKALVQTSLVVARRRNDKSARNNFICFVSAYASLFESSECISILKDCIHNNKNVKGVCEIKSVLQEELWNQNKSAYLSSVELSSLKDVVVINPAEIVGLDSYGIECFQGLRTGANTFFYLQRHTNSLLSSDGHLLDFFQNRKFCLPTIQGQEDLGESLSQGKVTKTYLLYIQNNVISKDRDTEKKYGPIPSDLEQYILDSENRMVNGKPIPSLSAVRTNVRKGKGGVLPRYWYMLPVLSKRHTASLFLPRLNGGRVWVRKNTYGQVIDANYVTIVLADCAPITVNAALALLNSTWAALQFEENCTVMGGGALKVDSVQMSRFFFPKMNQEQLEALDKLGTRALKMKINSPNLLDDIDRVVLSGLCCSPFEKTIQYLRELLTDYVNRRNGVR